MCVCRRAAAASAWRCCVLAFVWITRQQKARPCAHAVQAMSDKSKGRKCYNCGVSGRHNNRPCTDLHIHMMLLYTPQHTTCTHTHTRTRRGCPGHMSTACPSMEKAAPAPAQPAAPAAATAAAAAKSKGRKCYNCGLAGSVHHHHRHHHHHYYNRKVLLVALLFNSCARTSSMPRASQGTATSCVHIACRHDARALVHHNPRQHLRRCRHHRHHHNRPILASTLRAWLRQATCPRRARRRHPRRHPHPPRALLLVPPRTPRTSVTHSDFTL